MKKLILLSIILIVGCEETLEPEDCAGVTGGTAVEDDCGVCNGIDGYVAGSCYDCADVPFGTAELDNCNVCDSDKTNDCVPDCAGVWDGTSVDDCNGICGGSAVEDACGDCGGGMTVCPDSPLCTYNSMLPDCHGYDHPINNCYPANWVGDGWCDDEVAVYGFDGSCYSYDSDGITLCQIQDVGDIVSGLPICSENALPPDGGDCNCDQTEPGWDPLCWPYPHEGACPWCCGVYRDQCGLCEGDGQGCEYGCEIEGNYWGCDEVCYETEDEAPTIDLCGICGGDGSSCSSGD